MLLILADFISLLGLLESSNSLPLSKYCGLEQCILHCFVLIYFLCLYLIKKKKSDNYHLMPAITVVYKTFLVQEEGTKVKFKTKTTTKKPTCFKFICCFYFKCFIGVKLLTFTNRLVQRVRTLICLSGFCVTILQIMKVLQRQCVLPDRLSTCSIKVSITVYWFLTIFYLHLYVLQFRAASYVPSSFN